jgi:hypothetical protein
MVPVAHKRSAFYAGLGGRLKKLFALEAARLAAAKFAK